MDEEKKKKKEEMDDESLGETIEKKIYPNRE